MRPRGVDLRIALRRSAEGLHDGAEPGLPARLADPARNERAALARTGFLLARHPATPLPEALIARARSPIGRREATAASALPIRVQL